MEATMNVICYDGKKREEMLSLCGVEVGKIDTRLFGVFRVDTRQIIPDIEAYVINLINKTFDFEIRTVTEVKSFQHYLEKRGTTFKEWFENYMKEELLKTDFDYDKEAVEVDHAYSQSQSSKPIEKCTFEPECTNELTDC